MEWMRWRLCFTSYLCQVLGSRLHVRVWQGVIYSHFKPWWVFGVEAPHASRPCGCGGSACTSCSTAGGLPAHTHKHKTQTRLWVYSHNILFCTLYIVKAKQWATFANNRKKDNFRLDNINFLRLLSLKMTESITATLNGNGHAVCKKSETELISQHHWASFKYSYKAICSQGQLTQL